MNTYFISDLHLDAQHPEMIKIFVNFLQTTAANADALYILGDLFEVWVGDDTSEPYIQNLKSIFKKLTITVPIYFMHGNRDFLVGEQFGKETGIQLIPDPTVINLYGTPTLLTHGDLLCIDDHAYQLFRHKVRNEKNQKIFLRLPFVIRKLIARFLRHKSKKRASQNDYQFIDANFAELKKQMQQQNTKLIIYGHTHQPGIEYFNQENEMLMRVTLSDWEGCGNVLVCKENGEKRLVYL